MTVKMALKKTRWSRLVAGVAVVAAFGWGLTVLSDLPGVPGEVIRANVASGRDATALFYTEVDGWETWAATPPRTTIHHEERSNREGHEEHEVFDRPLNPES